MPMVSLKLMAGAARDMVVASARPTCVSRLPPVSFYRYSRKVFFCLTGPYLTGRATIGRLELPPGEGRFVCEPPTCGPPTHNGLYGPGFI